MVVIGDADFVTNLHVNVLGNRDLLLLAARGRGARRRHADGGPPPAVDQPGPFSTLALTAREARLVLLDSVRRSPPAPLALRRRRRRAASEAGGVTARGTLGGSLAALAWLGALWLDGVVTGRGHPAGAPAGDARHAAAARRSTAATWRASNGSASAGRLTAGAHAGRLGRRGGSSVARRRRRCGCSTPSATLHPHHGASTARPGDLAEYGLAPAAERLLRLATIAAATLLALDIGSRNPAWTGLLRTRRGPRRGAAGRRVAPLGARQAPFGAATPSAP